MELSSSIVNKIINKQINLDDLTNDDLAKFCQIANLKYRDGNPIISDEDYDFIYLPALKKRVPDHFLFKYIEPEGAGFSKEKILLPDVMLSIDKAYSFAQILKWIERLKKTSSEINLNHKDIQIKATPKLDGFAAFDDGNRLYTRGDGKKGSDISRVFDRGLNIYNDSARGQGPGEIVVKKTYFEKYLSDNFEHPRNFQASLIKEKSLNKQIKKVITEKAALFVPFSQLPFLSGDIQYLTNNFENIVTEVLAMVDFDIDGVVFEVTNKDLKNKIGSNRKFHRWQIAFKENKSKAKVNVIGITPQVGRTGKITPVAELEPIILSGAKIERATSHHYGMVKNQGLGKGSVIELTRSGLVIPKINKVLKPVLADIPKLCPSCQTILVWDSDFLICTNHKKCPAQIIAKIEYFFKVLANNDGFGNATFKKLYENNIHKVSQIYELNENDFKKIGFGDKTSANLVNQLERSKKEQIEDWRFLAAFGITRMGTGNCENLLKTYPLDQIFDLDIEKIANIEGFAMITAQSIFDGLKQIKDEFYLLKKYNFNLEITDSNKQKLDSNNALFGKKIVFTGKMNITRNEMKKQAKSVSIKILDNVNSKTDFLVVGDKPSQNKVAKAKKYKIPIMTEQNYLSNMNL